MAERSGHFGVSVFRFPLFSVSNRAVSCRERMNPDNFFAELKRRNVYQVAIDYVFVGAAVSLSLFFLGRYTAGNRTTASNDKKSIAVLPFASLSANKNDAYFADGVQDQILTNIAKVSDLKVISHTSVRQYKTGAERNMREIGRQLGVAYIME